MSLAFPERAREPVAVAEEPKAPLTALVKRRAPPDPGLGHRCREHRGWHGPVTSDVCAPRAMRVTSGWG